MNNFIKQYDAKKTDVEHVLSSIKSNEIIVSGMACMEPQLFLSRLHEISEKVSNVEVYTCLNMKNYEFYEHKECEGKFLNNSWFHNAGIRNTIKQGIKTVTYVPNNLHESGTNLLNMVTPDYYIGIASPMDDHGFMTLSLSATYEKMFAKRQKESYSRLIQMPQGHMEIHRYTFHRSIFFMKWTTKSLNCRMPDQPN